MSGFFLRIGPHRGRRRNYCIKFGFLRIENVQNSLIIDNKKPVTDNFKLLSNFPNPFNSSTIIKYQLNDEN